MLLLPGVARPDRLQLGIKGRTQAPRHKQVARIVDGEPGAQNRRVVYFAPLDIHHRGCFQDPFECGKWAGARLALI